MSLREDFEEREKNFISPYGCLSSDSRGRMRREDPCPIRTAFQRDRDRIVFSNAFRRLKHKTQVFLSPLGDQYRTRLTHTLEVAQIARTIARAMRLNEDLTEAIALGHDLGHTPFGHGGEIALKEIYSQNFSHNEQSLRVIDILEHNGKGLNLTYEVRDGILKHSKGHGDVIPKNPNDSSFTVEGKVVRISDILAYLNHDLDDAIRSGIIRINQVPDSCKKNLGESHSERVTTMIRDLVYTSRVINGEFCLQMSDKVCHAMMKLRKFLYDNVYRADKVHQEFVKAKRILSDLYSFFLNNEKMLQKEMENMEMGNCNHQNQPKERIVADLIASITDRYALNLYKKFFFPYPLV
ncbi:MAG TPA: deoxyguanosinetriphosphate triphosphohydrolase [Desulfobacteraceae bacterium]|nr:deoxyguanosinetriphosphate triphosphohydrolase [Desulfobacteraceae bacterium]